MSKQFEFADLVGKKIVGVTAEFGGHGEPDDYVGLDINDGTQVQLVGSEGTLVLIHGELEDLLDREVVVATHTTTCDWVEVQTFVLAVQTRDLAGEPVGVKAVLLQFVLNEADQAFTVECKA